MSSRSTTKWSRALLLASLGALSACGSADPGDDGATFPTKLATDLQAAMDETVAQGAAPGVTLYVSHPERGTWSGAAGLGDIEQGRPATTDGHFRAGSMVKVLVATAVLQKVESGQIDLGAKLTELLPYAITKHVARASEIDVRMLLNHTSGIPDFLSVDVRMAAAADQAHIWTLDELLTSSAKQPPTGAPGEAHSYSNTNYVLLGEILRAKTGRDWREVVTEYVMKRAKMTQSSLPLPGDREMPAPVIRGYLDIGNGPVDFTRMDPSMADAAGGHALITTPADLTIFLEALLAGKLFDRPATLHQMLAFLPGVDDESPQTEYGLGVQVSEMNGVRFIGHMGRTAGYWGFTWYVPKTGYYFTGQMNRDNDLGAFAFPIAKLLSE
jgi:D-alanyl-D-alanine carboxypeptidase